MISSQLYLNGKAIPREKVPDFEIAVSPNTNCYMPQYEQRGAAGAAVCRYPRFKETLPNGKVYYTLDLISSPQDDTAPFVVPEGHMFLMGDNRDNSLDSRFPAIPGQGIGIVPQDNLVGRATVMMFSTDGSAEWIKPWTWFSAARWNRIGGMF
jgi:signal peptidase I